jgi:hypothetical protein
MIEVEPQPRVDPLVGLPGGGDARRAEYTGPRPHPLRAFGVIGSAERTESRRIHE